MSERAWEKVIPESDRAIYARMGLGRAMGYGRKPAVLVIDVQVRTLGDRPLPLPEALEEWPVSCGLAGWHAIDAIEKILQAARARAVPVIYTRVERASPLDVAYAQSSFPVSERGQEIVPRIAPHPGDLVLVKKRASAFFGTPLISSLIQQGIDTLVLTGTATSGCVRATAIESWSYNFKTIVVEEGVYDRAELSHQINLWDMNSKYAQVVPVADVLAYLNG
ncbi:MAG: isochorismatase family protein [Chloroflexi bacterium]|nr:isochorismatase family protein [Chloroflexota bacterium]